MVDDRRLENRSIAVFQ